MGDAGAIPYLSGIGALDGLGLGGYHDLPFARASVHGVPAVIELVERLAAAERPDVMALYPSWWPGLVPEFGERAFGVKIEGNVIRGADEKVVYRADWSTLAPPGEARAGAADEIDVADLVSEREHDYRSPGPRGGWVIGARLLSPDGRARFDAGRIVPEGKRESFRLREGLSGEGVLVLRTDPGAAARITVSVERAGQSTPEREVELPPREPSRWHEIRAPLGPVRGGDRVRITARRGAFRGYHAWVEGR